VLVPWLLVPAVMAVVLTAWGALAESAARTRVPGALLPSLGLAALVVGCGALLTFPATHALAVPVAVAGTLGGLVALARRHRTASPVPAAVVAGGTFVLLALPSLLTGQGAIAGYIQLDDAATWLGLTGHVFDHGRPVGDIPVGTVRRAVESYLGTGYPLGAFVGPGTASRVTGQDLAFVLQPWLCVLGAVTALGLLAVLRGVVRGRGLAVAAALVAGQASLFVAFANWGGLKELTTTALLAPAAWLAVRGITARLARDAPDPRAGLADGALLLVVGGALLTTLGVLGVVWAGPPLAAGAALLVLRRPVAAWPALAVAAGGAVLTVLAVRPTLNLRNQVETPGGLGAAEELGNLVAPLRPLQAAGLFPDGDFRIAPDGPLPAVVAVACLVLAAGGLALAARRRRAELPAFAGIVLLGAAATWVVGSPWVDAKAMAVAAPAVLALAVALPAALGGRAGTAGVAALGAVALVSTGLVARDAWVAPHDSFADLARAGELLDGRGPTLELDPDPYAGRHFLRRADGDGASDLRQRLITLRDGTLPGKLAPVDVESVAPAEITPFRAIVRRRSPVASRPPLGFERRWAGGRWEVWERGGPFARATVTADLPLATGIDPGAPVTCDALDGLAAGAGALVAAPTPDLVIVEPATWRTPADWTTAGGVVPDGAGTIGAQADVPRAGRWRVWIGGTVLGRLEVEAGGRDVGHVRHELAHGAPWLRFGTVELPAGRVPLTLRHEGRRSAGPIGPIVLTPAAADRPAPLIVARSTRERRALCDGRRLDWIAAVR
jgi:hypothetical protein